MIPTCLALDVGSERVGVATNVGSLVLPKASIPRSEFKKWFVDEAPRHDYLIVGLPIDLRGDIGISARQVVDFVSELQLNDSVEIRFVDERLTTAIANRRLREVGKNSRSSRSIVDAQAAAEILELALTANPEDPGRKIDEF